MSGFAHESISSIGFSTILSQQKRKTGQEPKKMCGTAGAGEQGTGLCAGGRKGRVCCAKGNIDCQGWRYDDAESGSIVTYVNRYSVSGTGTHYSGRSAIVATRGETRNGVDSEKAGQQVPRNE